MTAFFARARTLFRKPPAPAAAEAPEEERLQVLVGRQRVITRGRASVSGSEGLVRDAI